MTRASAGTRVNSSGLVETVELLGSELVTDKDFALTGTQAQNITGTYWTTGTGWTIGGGKAICNGTNISYLTQTGILNTGTSYKVQFDIIDYTSGSVKYRDNGLVSGQSFSGIGSYTDYVVAGGGQFRLMSENFIGSISNVSVKESTKNNLARVDYDGTASSLLVEPQRTNLVLNSEPTTNEGAAANITYESFSWDIGFDNCVVFGDNSVLRYRYGSSVTSGTEYTLSAYILMDDNSEPIVSNNNSIGDFSLNIGNTAASGTNTSVSMGNNIWRVSKTQTATQTTSNNGVIKYTGQSSKGFKVVGLQMEVGSYPTSYIPTSGSTVTRVQDQYSKTGISNLINNEEGVLFVEIVALDSSGTYRLISLSDGTDNNRVFIGLNTATGYIYYYVIVGGVVKANFTTSTFPSAFTKVAVKYKENDFALWVNGVEVSTDSGGTTFPVGTLDRLKFESGNAGLVPFFGKVKQLQVFKTALTDSELATLTT
jgi:hypothetical protein